MTVLLGDPAYFRIQSGNNPHTRDRWGRRKRVDVPRAIAQWNELRKTLESHGVRVTVIPPVEEEPGLVFPANAGFRFGSRFYLSRLNPARAGERPIYRQVLTQLGIPVEELPCSFPFEGEADFIGVGDPSGEPQKKLYLFTFGKIEQPRLSLRGGFPPYRRTYGFRSDRRVLSTLQSIVGTQEVLPLELVNEAHYHGDTVLCPFGPREEFLLAYLPALSNESQATLRYRLGERLIPLRQEDGLLFAANSFQIPVDSYGERRRVLLMPDGLTDRLYATIRQLGVIPCPVDVSEFLEKGGGAVKCMLLDLGQPSYTWR